MISVAHTTDDSFKVVPIFRVALEDILDGKHLPPLSLKDFEEYLLFDERSAENLCVLA